MAQFRYKAKNMEGKMRRGVMEAVSEKALQQDLKEQGFYLISAKKAGGLRGRKKFTSRQLAEFNRELSSLLTAGVSLVPGPGYHFGRGGRTGLCEGSLRGNAFRY